MNFLQKVAMIAAGFGISGAIGAVSGVLLLYVLIDAAIAGADEAVWLYLCAAVGVIVGAICFKMVLWAGKKNSYLS
ncbi:MAG: hypothetical protein VXY11_04860 [Candidatus Thermoplasmatota archaeon]|nr:hypothetical protein [Candidatus Thermoplasmatota archaeon]